MRGKARAVGAKGWGGVNGAGPLARNIFSSKNDKFGRILTQFLTGRKYGQSLRHRFYGLKAKRSLQNSAKIIENSRSDQGGGRLHNPNPEYATGQHQNCCLKQSKSCDLSTVDCRTKQQIRKSSETIRKYIRIIGDRKSTLARSLLRSGM